MHPEKITQSKIRAQIFGFAITPPLFSVMKALTKKSFWPKKKSFCDGISFLIRIVESRNYFAYYSAEPMK